MKTRLCVVLAGFACAPALADFTVDFDVPVTFAGSDLDGIVGSGIPNSNFVRATNAAQDIEIGLKTIERFIGDLPNSQDRYFAPRGESDPGLSRWNYVLVADLGSRTIADLQINLLVDFDPAFGSADFVDVDVTANAVAGGFGGLSVFGDSQNLGFSFWQTIFGAPAFDPFATGEYEMLFTVRDPSSGEILAEAGNIVQVVPAPTAALGAAPVLLAFGATRRRRR